MLLVITALVVFLNIFLGLLAFWKTQKSATSRMFLILSIILSLWAITNYFSVNTLDKEAVFFWLKSVMVVTAAMFPAIYLLVRAFPGTNINLAGRTVILIVLFVLATQILVISGAVFQGVEIAGNVVTPVPGLGMPVFVVNVLLFLGLSIFNLLKKYRDYVGREKVQLKFLILGIVVTFSLATATNFLFVNFLKITSFVAVGPLFTLILVGSIFYAIVKHRFLDIRLVVARAVSFTLLILVFGLFYALCFGIAFSFFVTTKFEIRTVLVSAVLAMFMAFSFHPLRGAIEKISDRFFFRSKYDEGNLLYELAVMLAATLELRLMAEKFLSQLLTEMKISRGVLYVFSKDGGVEIYKNGYDHLPNFDKEKFLTMMNWTSEEILFEEMPEGDMKNFMRENGFSLLGQLKTENELIGVLALGEKLSGDIFSYGDIHTLKIIFPEVAIALQNARAYEEIEQFNITLQDKIKKATNELLSLNEKLKELDKLKSEFVSVASHELRTPMTAIKSYLWMALTGKGGALNEKQTYYLERSYSSTDRLIKLVNDLLNISRIESGKLAVDMQKIDLCDLVNQVTSEVKPRFDEMGISLVVGESFRPGTMVLADGDKIKEVVINLIGNSLKFTGKGGRVAIEMELGEKMVTVIVTDTGEGISSEDLPKLFQKFGLVKESYATNQNVSQGTGLGLYISKSIIELHGGAIWASSEGKGRGTTFKFTLPIYTQEGFVKASETKNPNGLEIIHNTL